MEPPARAQGAETSAKMVDALRRSLVAVKLEGAYVTWSSQDLLEELLSLEPAVLVAVGPAAARAIDTLNPAIDDAEAKHYFWQAFLALRCLAPEMGSASHP